MICKIYWYKYIMKIWIVWLPNVGKSTLFNALTKSYAADAANFPFCTIEPNIWIVDVRDSRIDKLAQISNSQKIIYANVKFVDIAWLVKWASQWEGLGNKFLANVREVDAIVQVLRYFADENVLHVHDKVDPIYDSEIINTELIISDMESVAKQLPSLVKISKKTKEQEDIYDILLLCEKILNQGKYIYDMIHDFAPEQLKILKSLNLITSKPLIYAINVAESDLNKFLDIENDISSKLGSKKCIVLSAKLESELQDMDDNERIEYISDTVGNKFQDYSDYPTLDRLIKSAFDTVGLQYYFTTWEKETRAWTIPKWSTAPQAAGAIHTDFERWFIKAEIVKYDDLIAAGTWSKAKEAGKLWLQGKDYIMHDGDVVVFKFNV